MAITHTHTHTHTSVGNTIGLRNAPIPATPAAPRRRQLGRRSLLLLGLHPLSPSTGPVIGLGTSQGCFGHPESGSGAFLLLSLVSGVGGVDWGITNAHAGHVSGVGNYLRCL